jgi:hypothetical protein
MARFTMLTIQILGVGKVFLAGGSGVFHGLEFCRNDPLLDTLGIDKDQKCCRCKCNQKDFNDSAFHVSLFLKV